MTNEQPDQLSIDDSGPRVRLAVPAMTRVRALLVALIPTVMLTLAEDQSRRNKSEQPDSFGVEPSVLKQTSQMLRVGLENTICPSTVEVAVAARTFSHGRRPLGSIQST
jgi:hypothetical protein